MVARLAPWLRLGLGARPGSGRQYVPWIHLEDLVSLIATALPDPQYDGAVDAVAPAPARMGELLDGLARAVGRRVRLAVPGPLVRLALGEAADVLLSSQNPRGERLRELGFVHKYPTLAAALADLAALPSQA